MVKVSWSKKFTTAIQKTNKNHFQNNKILLADRISTFEGGQHLVEIKCVASDISKRNIEIVCDNISEHIIQVSGGNIQITWMTLYFKVDPQGNLWFQFCSSVKVRDYVNFLFKNFLQFKKKESEFQEIKSPRLMVLRKDKLSNYFNFFRSVKMNETNFGVVNSSDEEQKFCVYCLGNFYF